MIAFNQNERMLLETIYELIGQRPVPISEDEAVVISEILTNTRRNLDRYDARHLHSIKFVLNQMLDNMDNKDKLGLNEQLSTIKNIIKKVEKVIK